MRRVSSRAVRAMEIILSGTVLSLSPGCTCTSSSRRGAVGAASFASASFRALNPSKPAASAKRATVGSLTPAAAASWAMVISGTLAGSRSTQSATLRSEARSWA